MSGGLFCKHYLQRAASINCSTPTELTTGTVAENRIIRYNFILDVVFSVGVN